MHCEKGISWTYNKCRNFAFCLISAIVRGVFFSLIRFYEKICLVRRVTKMHQTHFCQSRTRQKILHHQSYKMKVMPNDNTCTSRFALNSMMLTKASTSLAMASLRLARCGKTLFTTSPEFTAFWMSLMCSNCLYRVKSICKIQPFNNMFLLL